jgi:hypothetical protein
MKKKLINALLLFTTVCMFITISACEEPNNPITGAWECHDESVPHDWMCKLLFTPDGRFVDRDGDEGDWELTNGLLTLRWDEYPPYEVLVTITLNTLTIEQGVGLNVHLSRVD